MSAARKPATVMVRLALTLSEAEALGYCAKKLTECRDIEESAPEHALALYSAMEALDQACVRARARKRRAKVAAREKGPRCPVCVKYVKAEHCRNWRCAAFVPWRIGENER